MRSRTRRSRLGALVGVCLVAGACGLPASPAAPLATTPAARAANAAETTDEQAAQLFDYDRSKPLGIELTSTEKSGGAEVQRITYVQLDGVRTHAILVLPSTRGPFGGALFLHGAGGSPDDWLDEAVAVAGRGVVSLLVTQPEGRQAETDPAPYVTEIEFEMRELRRALDLLASQPGVDPHRLAFVGYSYGAVRGATFAGIEGSRLTAAVLICLNPRYGSPDMAAFDPIVWLPHVAPAALLMQLGRRDAWYTEADGAAMLAAAREPKRLIWYDTGHWLNDQATADRDAWLEHYVGYRG